MQWWQILLFPFTVLYRLITDFRNYLYDIGYKRSFKFQTNVIAMGNLTVGGTGKTPHVEYLIRLLQQDFKIATLSRGYGRTTKGFKIATDQDSAQTIGDEPYQFFSKFKRQITVVVGEQRALAIPSILLEKPETEVIILDDAYQHRPVTPNYNILLTDYNRLFYYDFPFPSGRLRESRNGAKRADMVIVSKCPVDISEQEQMSIQNKIKRYILPKTPIFFTTFQYDALQPVYKNDSSAFLEKNLKIMAFAGLANPTPFMNHLREKSMVIEKFLFPDHHHYTLKEINSLRKSFLDLQADFLITTEKDFVKFLRPDFQAVLEDIPFFYLPIQVYFLANAQEFENYIREAILKQKTQIMANFSKNP